MSDRDDKIARLKLEELTALDETQKRLLKSHEVLVVHELRRVLERQAERDLVIDEMRGIVDTLAVGHVMAIEEIKKLKNAQSVLMRQQAELHARQDAISSFADKLEHEAQERVRLAEEIADRD